MQCQAPFSSKVDSTKSKPRRMLCLPSSISDAVERESAGPFFDANASGRLGGAGSYMVFLRNSSDDAPVLASSRSLALYLLFGLSTRCEIESDSSCTCSTCSSSITQPNSCFNTFFGSASNRFLNSLSSSARARMSSLKFVESSIIEFALGDLSLHQIPELPT